MVKWPMQEELMALHSFSTVCLKAFRNCLAGSFFLRSARRSEEAKSKHCRYLLSDFTSETATKDQTIRLPSLLQNWGLSIIWSNCPLLLLQNNTVFEKAYSMMIIKSAIAPSHFSFGPTRSVFAPQFYFPAAAIQLYLFLWISRRLFGTCIHT